MIFPDVLVIGLAHRAEWQNLLVGSLTAAGFSGVSVLDAVDWRDLSVYPPWRVGSLVPVHPYPGWCDMVTRRALTLGEVGCSLSHILAWHRVAELDRPVLILEDDAVLVEDLVDQIPHILRDLSHIDYSVCYFYHHTPFNIKDEDRVKFPRLAGRFINHVDYCPASLMAYVLSPKGAQTLLSTLWQRYLVPADILLPATFALHGDPYMNRLFAGMDVASESCGVIVSTLQPFFTFREMYAQSETEKSPTVLEHRESFLVLTACSKELDDGHRLRWSARRFGYSLEVLGGGVALDGWRGGGGWKVNMLRSRLTDVPADTVILFIDSEGGVMNGFVNDIIYYWRNSLGGKVVFAASRVSVDDDYVDLYPSCDTPYCFLNSGIFMGKAGDLRALLLGEISDDGDDRRYYTELFLGLKEGITAGDGMMIDTRCVLFQSLADSLDDVVFDSDAGRLYNKRMRSRPCVVHADGETALEWLEDGGKTIGGYYREHYGFTDRGIPGI